MILIRVKNNTPNPDTWVGTYILPGAYYTIEDVEKPRWEIDEKVLRDVKDRNLVVNDGKNDLSEEDGLLRLRAIGEQQQILFTDKDLNSKTVGEAIVEASTMSTGTRGMTFSSFFRREIPLFSETVIGDLVIPFQSKILSITSYCEENASVDVDLRWGNKRETVRMRGQKSKTVYEPEGVLNRGDFLEVIVTPAGTTPEKIRVFLIFQSLG